MNVLSSARRRRPRRGLSLTEVLIAIFVMAIGMISLLVLFPVGMLNVKWAIDSNRIAAAAANGASSAEVVRTDPVSGMQYSLRNDPNYAPTSPTNLLWAICSPAYPTVPTDQEALWDSVNNQWTFDVSGNNPFPPVFIDPVGAAQYAMGLPDTRPALGGTAYLAPFIGFPRTAAPTTPPAPLAKQPLPQPGFPSSRINRVSLGLPRVRPANVGIGLVGMSQAMRWATSDDEISFGSNGQPVGPMQPAGPDLAPLVQRDRRYSWAYVCRWPRGTSDQVCDLQLVMFTGRTLNGAGYTSPPGEINYVNDATTTGDPAGRVFVKGTTTATIAIPTGVTQAAVVKPGDWVLDNTFILPDYITTNINSDTGKPFVMRFTDTYNPMPVPVFNSAGVAGVPLKTGLANGYFYKVIGVGDIQMDPKSLVRYQTLELDRPAKADGFVATFISNVADVIDKSDGRMPVR